MVEHLSLPPLEPAEVVETYRLIQLSQQPLEQQDQFSAQKSLMKFVQ